jgi:hypothetical protein
MPAMNVEIPSAAPAIISVIDRRRLGPGRFAVGTAGAVIAPSSPVIVFRGDIPVIDESRVVDAAGHTRPGT